MEWLVFSPGDPTIHTIEFKRLPRLFFFSLGALCALLITALVLEQRTATLVEQQTQAYGAALARTAAQQAVDAALNHDLVSLQVTLQDVVDNSNVVFATIHDVENNLLVQAGNAFAARADDISVVGQTAPITLHDSVAGYVTVSVAVADVGAGTVVATVSGIALVLVLVGALAIYDHRTGGSLLPGTAPPASDDDEPAPDTDASKAEPVTNHSDREQLEPEPESTHVGLRLLNMPQLRKQLSVSMFEDLLTSVEQRLEDVLGVYNGWLDTSHQTTDSDSYDYQLQFTRGEEESKADCSFRAVCAVYLLSRLLAESQPASVSLGATVDLESSAEPPDAPQLLLAESIVELMLPQQRLLVREAPASQPDDQHYQLQGFVEPVRRLLERQYEQLRQLR